MKFNTWIDTLISEKNIDTEATFDVEGERGTNVIPYGVVIEGIKNTSTSEQTQIKKTLVMIDFKNGDVCHYLRHLGQALAI
jgi:hypothetical protein